MKDSPGSFKSLEISFRIVSNPSKFFRINQDFRKKIFSTEEEILRDFSGFFRIVQDCSGLFRIFFRITQDLVFNP